MQENMGVLEARFRCEPRACKSGRPRRREERERPWRRWRRSPPSGRREIVGFNERKSCKCDVNYTLCSALSRASGFIISTLPNTSVPINPAKSKLIDKNNRQRKPHIHIRLAELPKVYRRWCTDIDISTPRKECA